MADAPLDWDAAAYGALPLPHVGWGRRTIAGLELRGDERVLDLGCGTGRDAAWLLENWPGTRLIGVDVSPRMLAAARAATARFGERASIVAGNLEQGLAIDGTVDAAYSVAALHWVHDHQRVFDAVAGLLPSGARFSVDAGGAGNIARVRAALARVTGDAGDADWNFADIPTTTEPLRRAGFAEADVALRPDPVVLSDQAYLSYLATVVMPAQLRDVPEAEREPVVRRVAAEVGEPIVDYVRLEIRAVR